jgi:hypothetical protein
MERTDFSAMSDSIQVPQPEATPSTSAASGAEDGVLSITTEPSALVIRVFDHEMTTVAEGASPYQVTLSPGLYCVRAFLAGHPDLVKMEWVLSGSTRSVHLSNAEPSRSRSASETASKLVDKYMRKLVPLPAQAQSGTEAVEPEMVSEPFWIRFWHLKNWGTAEAVSLPRFTATYVRGRAILGIRNPWQKVAFAQIACGQRVLNVAIPPGSERCPVQCQLVILPGNKLLEAHVRISTEWANSCMQYMARGYLQEAKQLVLTVKRQQSEEAEANPLVAGFQNLRRRILNRFDDPAAELVPRYLGLRTREATIFNTFGDSLLDIFQGDISDGRIITSEVYARTGQFRLAAQQILTIRPGRLPLFTEGFSLLIHRVGELLSVPPDSVKVEERVTSDQKKDLITLKRTLDKWAPYVNLNSPTITFPGQDITAPKEGESPISPTSDAGWIPGPRP